MPYKTVGLIGKAAHKGAHASLNALADYLRAKHCTILVEETVAAEMDCDDFTVCDLVTIGKQADLAVVVGGDGNMLGAARVLSRFNIHVVGVNRGNLGFLTDIHPDEVVQQMDLIYNGETMV